MIALPGGLYIRAVPDHLLAGVADKSLRVIGSIIQNVATGKVEGHLQEAPAIARLVGRLISPAASASPGAAQALDAVQLVQGEFIRAGVNRLEDGVRALTRLGQVDLALTGINLGVAVVGFSLMALQIQSLKRTIATQDEKLDRIVSGIRGLEEQAMLRDLADLQGLSKGFDEGWSLSGVSAERRWHDVASGALALQSRFEVLARHVMSAGLSAHSIADPLLDAVSMAGALRVAALASCNETLAAQSAAADGASTLEGLTATIGAADLVRAALLAIDSQPGSRDWAMAQAQINHAARGSARKLRMREAAALTRAAPLNILAERSVSPRQWLEAVRNEAEAPLLILAAGR